MLEYSTSALTTRKLLAAFLYLNDYNPSNVTQLPYKSTDHYQEDDNPSPSPNKDHANPVEKEAAPLTYISLLLLHAKVYTLADCYDILDLKQLALRKFNAIIPERWSDIRDVPAFLALVREVYALTNDFNPGLRNVIAKVFHEYIKQLIQV
jgi:hypothetical protein